MKSSYHFAHCFLAAFVFTGIGGCASATDISSDEDVQTASAPSTLGDDDCATVHAWIDENQDRLPSTYDDLSSFPVPYRRGIFNTHSAAIKSSLWKAHLVHYMETHPSLTEDQRNALEKAKSFVSEQLYTNSSAANVEATQQITNDIRNVFDAVESGAIFAQLGSSRSFDMPQANPLTEFCNCSLQSDQCWIQGNYTCKYNVITCTWTGSGCGAFWTSSCNGYCVGN